MEPLGFLLIVGKSVWRGLKKPPGSILSGERCTDNEIGKIPVFGVFPQDQDIFPIHF
jgi:hypothetical protein